MSHEIRTPLNVIMAMLRLSWQPASTLEGGYGKSRDMALRITHSTTITRTHCG